jgi:hypothetical protein
LWWASAAEIRSEQSPELLAGSEELELEAAPISRYTICSEATLANLDIKLARLG